MELSKSLFSLKIRTLLLLVGLIWLLMSAYNRFFVPRHKFTELRDDNVANQWENIETLLVASRHHHVPLLLFDIDILPNIFVSREPSWKDTIHRCKVLCKHHPEEKNVITFAALASKFEESKDEFMDALMDLGFVVHLSEVIDPRHDRKKGELPMTPSYLWMARNDHVIHVTFLHERGDEIKYLWVAPVPDREWKRTVRKLAPMLSDGWHSLENVGAKFPRYAQAYDMSHRFTGLPVDLDGHRISVPYHIMAFLEEYRNSRFIECSQSNPQNYLHEENRMKTKKPLGGKKYQSEAKALLVEVKKILDNAKIPFWITGGSLLGWYRQCNFILDDSDLDIAIWSRDFKDEVIQELSRKGFTYTFDLTRISQRLDVHFLNKKGHKVNFLFFDQENTITQSIRTRPTDDQKFLLIYSPFVLCWTEFVGSKVQVPCDSLAYLEGYFGNEWFQENKEWIWYIDAKNKMILE